MFSLLEVLLLRNGVPDRLFSNLVTEQVPD